MLALHRRTSTCRLGQLTRSCRTWSGERRRTATSWAVSATKWPCYAVSSRVAFCLRILSPAIWLDHEVKLDKSSNVALAREGNFILWSLADSWFERKWAGAGEHNKFGGMYLQPFLYSALRCACQHAAEEFFAQSEQCKIFILQGFLVL